MQIEGECAENIEVKNELAERIEMLKKKCIDQIKNIEQCIIRAENFYQE